MSDEAWKSGFVRCLGVQLFGEDIDVDEHGEDINGDTILLIFNVDHVNTIPFIIPPPGGDDNGPWEMVFDTAVDNGSADDKPPASPYPVQPCSMVVLRSELKRPETI
jgi:isoamylase